MSRVAARLVRVFGVMVVGFRGCVIGGGFFGGFEDDEFFGVFGVDHDDEDLGGLFRVGVAADAVEDHGGFVEGVAGFECFDGVVAEGEFEGAFEDVAVDHAGVSMGGMGFAGGEFDGECGGFHGFGGVCRYVDRLQDFDVGGHVVGFVCGGGVCCCEADKDH